MTVAGIVQTENHRGCYTYWLQQ